MKTTIVCVGLLIVYAIMQEQLPCNFSVTCLMGMPTLHQSIADRWTGKITPRTLFPDLPLKKKAGTKPKSKAARRQDRTEETPNISSP